MSLNLRALALIGAGLLLLVVTGLWQMERAERRLAEQRHIAFAARVEAKAERIRANFIEYKARIEARQRTVTQEVSREYQIALDALRRDYERRLRNGAGSAGDRSSGPAPSVSGVPPAPAGPDGPAASVDEWAARANTLQLEFLQRWVREQLQANRGE